MRIWTWMYRKFFLEERIGVVGKTLPRLFDKKTRVIPCYRPQLDYLVELLSIQLSDVVTYLFEPDGKAVLLQRENETIARIIIYPKGQTSNTTYILVRTDVLRGAKAWFQLAFVNVKVKMASTNETLFLK
jgi:hypothetical protein